MHFVRFTYILTLAVLLPAVAQASPEERVAVVVSQAVGVGPLADHLGNLVSEQLSKGSVRVIGPGESARLLRDRGGSDPSSCGSDSACLRKLAETLDARWVVALGVGSFGEIFSLELRAVDRQEPSGAQTVSSTYAAPGPDWEQALSDGLQRIVPKRLLHRRGELQVRSEAHGAELRLNDLPAGTLPLQSPLRLPAGEYVVELSRDGFSSARETVRIDAGEVTEVRLALVPVGVDASPTDYRTYAWVGSGTAAASLVSAVVLHLSAAGSMDDARSAQKVGRPFQDDRDSALGQMTAARVMYGVAGVTAVGAAVLFWLDGAFSPGGAAAPAVSAP